MIKRLIIMKSQANANKMLTSSTVASKFVEFFLGERVVVLKNVSEFAKFEIKLWMCIKFKQLIYY